MEKNIRICSNEIRLYPNDRLHGRRFNVSICNDWFSKEFVYKVSEDRIVFTRPTLEYKKFPTRANKKGNSWIFFLTFCDVPVSNRLEIHDEDIDEDQAIVYL